LVQVLLLVQLVLVRQKILQVLLALGHLLVHSFQERLQVLQTQELPQVLIDLLLQVFLVVLESLELQQDL